MTGIVLVISGTTLVIMGILNHVLITRAKRNPKTQATIQNPVKEQNGNAISAELENLINIAVVDGVLTDNEQNMILKKAQEKGENIDSVEQILSEKLAQTSSNAETKLIDKLKETGDAFESYVVSKFDSRYFKLKEWAGDKYINGIYAETTTNPDLVFSFKAGKTSQTFAVECKYRSRFSKEGISWAKDQQFQNYKNFQYEKKIPVFIAIGVGGQPDDPEHLFIVPLDKINGTEIPQKMLNIYRKNNFRENNIYLDIQKLTLS